MVFFRFPDHRAEGEDGGVKGGERRELGRGKAGRSHQREEESRKMKRKKVV